MDEQEGIEKERGKVYGPPMWNHQCIGQVWGGLLTAANWEPGDPVPPDVVAAMMAGLKLVRGVHQWCYHEDSYLDAAVYTDFTGRFRKEIHEAKQCMELGEKEPPHNP